MAQLIFFEGGFRQTKCHVLKQSWGFHLVCIWGSLVKFQGGGVVVKTMLYARVQIRWVFVPWLTPVFQSSMSPSNERGVVSGWLSCCRTVMGLSSGMHLG